MGLPSKYRPGKVPRLLRPYDGTSIAFSYNAATASERNDLQYFEMCCNIGIAKNKQV